MKLSPLDIANHEFTRSMRGYAPEEVREFLGHVSDEVYSLQKRIKELSQNPPPAAQASPPSERQASSSASPEDFEAARAQIQQEREQMRREGQAEAEEMKMTVQRDLAAMREELRGLKLQRDAYVKRFRFLIKSQSELLDLLEKETQETADAAVEDSAR